MTRNFQLIKSSVEVNKKGKLSIWLDWQIWRLFGAFIGLFGGIVAALCGSILTALTWVSSNEDYYLKECGSVLLFSTIPLLIIGACCLDALEKKTKSKTEAVKRNFSIVKSYTARF